MIITAVIVVAVAIFFFAIIVTAQGLNLSQYISTLGTKPTDRANTPVSETDIRNALGSLDPSPVVMEDGYGLTTNALKKIVDQKEKSNIPSGEESGTATEDYALCNRLRDCVRAYQAEGGDATGCVIDEFNYKDFTVGSTYSDYKSVVDEISKVLNQCLPTRLKKNVGGDITQDICRLDTKSNPLSVVPVTDGGVLVNSASIPSGQSGVLRIKPSKVYAVGKMTVVARARDSSFQKCENLVKMHVMIGTHDTVSDYNNKNQKIFYGERDVNITCENGYVKFTFDFNDFFGAGQNQELAAYVDLHPTEDTTEGPADDYLAVSLEPMIETQYRPCNPPASDVMTNKIMMSDNPSYIGRGHMKLVLNNLNTTQANCQYNIAICSQDAFVNDTDDELYNIYDFVRTFRPDQHTAHTEYLYNSNGDTTATVLVYNYFEFDLNNPHIGDDITEAVRSGMDEWSRFVYPLVSSGSPTVIGTADMNPFSASSSNVNGLILGGSSAFSKNCWNLDDTLWTYNSQGFDFDKLPDPTYIYVSPWQFETPEHKIYGKVRLTLAFLKPEKTQLKPVYPIAMICGEHYTQY
jgi:hypothetical protein